MDENGLHWAATQRAAFGSSNTESGHFQRNVDSDGQEDQTVFQGFMRDEHGELIPITEPMTDKVQFEQVLKTKGMSLKHVIIMDSGSTIHSMCEGKYVIDERPAEKLWWLFVTSLSLSNELSSTLKDMLTSSSSTASVLLEPENWVNGGCFSSMSKANSIM